MSKTVSARRAAPHLYESRWNGARMRALRTALGRVPGPRRRPSYFVVGEKRCGTTSMHRLLLQHPQLLGPLAAKSTHYFDNNYAHGPEWYDSFFLPERLVSLRERDGRQRLAGDTSPYYLFHPLGGERIATSFPNAKAIVLLREPARRAWSHFQYERDKGNEPLAFADAIAAEDDRLAGEEDRLRADPTAVSDTHRAHSYVARSRYHETVSRLLSVLPADQVHIERSEDLYKDTVATLSRVHEFLGVDEFATQPTPAARSNTPERPPEDALEQIRSTLASDTAALYELVGRQLWD